MDVDSAPVPLRDGRQEAIDLTTTALAAQAAPSSQAIVLPAGPSAPSALPQAFEPHAGDVQLRRQEASYGEQHTLPDNNGGTHVRMQVLQQQLNVAMSSAGPQVVTEAWAAIEAARAEVMNVQTQAVVAVEAARAQAQQVAQASDDRRRHSTRSRTVRRTT